MASICSTMFREYDIRGRVNDNELNNVSVSLIAKGFLTLITKRGIGEVVLGWDSRETSERFGRIFADILVSGGVNVISIGMVLTPMLYSAQYHYKIRGGVMVTASHNPNEWNGIKLATDYSHTLSSDEIVELNSIIINDEFTPTALKKGNFREESFLDFYTQDVTGRIKIERPLKVLVNTGNGTAGPIVPNILRAAGCEVIEHLTGLDSSFLHYFPNPSDIIMMEDTGKKTVEAGVDIGVAIDGDGDRLGLTDEKGGIIWPDRYLILLSRQLLIKHPGAVIVFDVKCSQALVDDIKAHGGKAVMWKTGHSYIKSKIKEMNALLGGEYSGHVFIADNYYGFDDAVFAALKILEFVSQQNMPVSSVIAGLPQYVSGLYVQAECADEKKYEVVDRLIKEFLGRGYEVITINGARVTFSDGWGLVRASSNLPVIGIRCEAKTNERLAEIEKMFKDIIVRYPEVSEEWRSG